MGQARRIRVHCRHHTVAGLRLDPLAVRQGDTRRIVEQGVEESLALGWNEVHFVDVKALATFESAHRRAIDPTSAAIEQRPTADKIVEGHCRVESEALAVKQRFHMSGLAGA